MFSLPTYFFRISKTCPLIENKVNFEEKNKFTCCFFLLGRKNPKLILSEFPLGKFLGKKKSSSPLLWNKQGEILGEFSFSRFFSGSGIIFKSCKKKCSQGNLSKGRKTARKITTSFLVECVPCSYIFVVKMKSSFSKISFCVCTVKFLGKVFLNSDLFPCQGVFTLKPSEIIYMFVFNGLRSYFKTAQAKSRS